MLQRERARSDQVRAGSVAKGVGAGRSRDQPPADRQSVLRGYSGVVAILASLAVLAAAVCALSGTARHEFALSFIRQPTKYAELYFSVARAVEVSSGTAAATPSGQPAPGAVVNVFFAVGNHEGQAGDFPYQVQVTNDVGEVIGRTNGSVDVPNDQRSEVWARVDISADQQWSRVDVALTGRSEHIHFLRHSP